MDKPRIAFLCGAGTSKAAGMPSTMEITDEILSKKGIASTDNFRRYTPLGKSGEVIEQKHGKFNPVILVFLTNLKKTADKYNTNKYWGSSIEYKEQKSDLFSPTEYLKHEVNYEDLFFMLTQIYEHSRGDFNPYGNMLFQETDCQNAFENWKNQESFGVIKKSAPFHFIQYVAKYITSTVIQMLEKNDFNTNALSAIVHGYKDNDFQMKSIFSLNHDLVLEKCMAENDIVIVDGFGEKNSDIRIWNPTSYDSCDTGKIRLLKLHGSVDWLILEGNGGSEKNIKYSGDNNLRIQFLKSKDGSGYIFHQSEYSSILIGTDNKLKEYVSSVYWDLFFRFRSYLAETDCLVVCGYSFGDSPINNQILEWMSLDDERTMIVIDNKYEESFRKCLKLEFRQNNAWDTLKNNGRISYLQNKLENTTWDEIKSKINL